MNMREQEILKASHNYSIKILNNCSIPSLVSLEYEIL